MRESRTFSSELARVLVLLVFTKRKAGSRDEVVTSPSIKLRHQGTLERRSQALFPFPRGSVARRAQTTAAKETSSESRK